MNSYVNFHALLRIETEPTDNANANALRVLRKRALGSAHAPSRGAPRVPPAPSGGDAGPHKGDLDLDTRRRERARPAAADTLLRAINAASIVHSACGRGREDGHPQPSGEP